MGGLGSGFSGGYNEVIGWGCSHFEARLKENLLLRSAVDKPWKVFNSLTRVSPWDCLQEGSWLPPEQVNQDRVRAPKTKPGLFIT